MCFLLLAAHGTKGQELSFRHLGIEEGMPSNNTRNACFDSTGMIWVAASDGLISYDGLQLKQYLKETHPGLPSNELGFLYCDSRNRVWICSNNGISVMDEQRRIHRVTLHDTLKNKDFDFCMEVKGLGMVLFERRKTYLLPEKSIQWVPYTWFDSHVRKNVPITFVNEFNQTSALFIINQQVMLVHFLQQKILTGLQVANAISASKINEQEILVANSKNADLCRVNINNGTITKKYTGVLKATGMQPVQTAAVFSSRAANGYIYISTRSMGLIGFDPVRDSFFHYTHHPLNKNSISSNNIRRVFTHPNGFMLVSSPQGLNITNVHIPMLRQQTNFIDERGNIIDDVSCVGEDVNGLLWLSNQNRLFIWNSKTNKARDISPQKIFLPGDDVNNVAGSIHRDKDGFMWVSYNGNGVARFSSDGRLLNFLTSENNGLPSNRIRIINQLNNGMLIIGAENGLYLLNPKTMRPDTLGDHPLLNAIKKKRIIDIMPDGDEVWIAASPNGAAYCYNFSKKTIKIYTEKEGLSSNRVYCIGKDLYNNIYIGTFNGLNRIRPGGSIQQINQLAGLRNPRVDNIATDRKGRLWITNFNSLTCFNPADSTYTYFDEQNGVSNAGFAVGQALLTRDDKIIFRNNGLLIADTRATFGPPPPPVRISVTRLYNDGGYDLLNTGSVIRLQHNDAHITLYYLTNTLVTANRFFYRYRMEGLDKKWQQSTKNNQVTYNLNPGKYVFHIQAAYNEGNWADGETVVTIIVLPPWWQTGWFRLLVAALLAAMLYFLYRWRIRTIKTKAVIKQRMAELEGKALRAQMNPHFIFNSLNAIQELVVMENYTGSYQYLSKFSKLLRMVLHNSEKNLIPLNDEIEMNRLYLELESLRFKQSFHYSIEIGENTDTEWVLFPSLLLQPFIENAIWHGLMQKEGEKKLTITLETRNQLLYCIIEDNGIGRVRAAEIKAQKLGAAHLVSKGTELAQQRVEVLRESGMEEARITTTDLFLPGGEPSGTRVEIVIPLLKNHTLE